MREIKLTKGKSTIVSDEDYELVSKYKWYTHSAHSGSMNFYARRSFKENGSKRSIRLHRFLMDAPEGTQVDHINGDGLDNRRCNLRFATQAQNQANQRSARGSSSMFKGVGWFKQTKRWVARIKKDKKEYHLGYFDDEIKAAEAYDIKAKELFGEFAKLNLN